MKGKQRKAFFDGAQRSLRRAEVALEAEIVEPQQVLLRLRGEADPIRRINPRAGGRRRGAGAACPAPCSQTCTGRRCARRAHQAARQEELLRLARLDAAGHGVEHEAGKVSPSRNTDLASRRIFADTRRAGMELDFMPRPSVASQLRCMILHGGADVRGWQPRAAAAHAGFQVAADIDSCRPGDRMRRYGCGPRCPGALHGDVGRPAGGPEASPHRRPCDRRSLRATLCAWLSAGPASFSDTSTDQLTLESVDRRPARDIASRPHPRAGGARAGCHCGSIQGLTRALDHGRRDPIVMAVIGIRRIGLDSQPSSPRGQHHGIRQLRADFYAKRIELSSRRLPLSPTTCPSSGTRRARYFMREVLAWPKR